MDKRWIGIILILIAGLSCMFVIVINSSSVGSAVSVIEDVTVTLPPGYITADDGQHFCQMVDQKTGESIRIKCIEGKSSHVAEYNKQIKTYNEQPEMVIVRNFTNDTVSIIDYKNTTSEDKDTRSFMYFDKCGHTFSMKMKGFADDKSRNEDFDYVVSHLKYDFKQRT